MEVVIRLCCYLVKLSSHMERGVACIIHDINLCTSVNEQACNLAVAIGNRNMQLWKRGEREKGHMCVT